MSCYSGPEISNNGLVFHYDMNNTQKSWKGAPTTNLASGNFFYGNGVNFPVNQNVSDIMPDGSIGIARELNAQIVSDPNRTVSIGSYSLTAGATYTLSFYAKNISCTGFGGNLYSTTLSRVIGGITYPALNAKTWTRVITTFTVPNEGPNPVVLAPQVFRDGGIGYFRLCWLMLEQSSIASSYVESSRTNTQSILDLTKNNTITINNLSYSSNNTFSFDGTDDYISLEQPPILDNITSGSMCVWFKRTATNATYQMIFTDGYSNLEFCFYQNGFQFYLSNSNIGTYGGLSALNVWYNVVGTWDVSTNTRSLYVNGASVVTNTCSVTSGSGYNRYIGGRGTSLPFTGNIPTIQVYNRALSASEIRQNFEATRGRYGI